MPDDNIYGKLETALQAIQIHNNSSFSWFGKKEPSLPAKLRRELPPADLRGYLVSAIQRRLYSDFYCRGQATPSSPRSTPPILSTSNAIFLEKLSNANSGKGCWEDGWRVKLIYDRHVVVQQHELSFAIPWEDCRATPGQPIEIGRMVRIRMPKELLAASPGFYVALGDLALYQSDEVNIVRFYCNLNPDGAVRFMEAVTSEFNQARLPFRLKVANHLGQFNRCDTVVLYFSQHNYGDASRILENLHSQFAEFLRRGTPVFTKPVTFGIGVAEAPPLGMSFGSHRCKILAESILLAHEQGKRSMPERLQTVVDAFREQQISVETPYLNPGSADHYGFKPGSDGSGQIENNPDQAAGGELDQQHLLRTAFDIGQLLARRAIWHADRCNWLGVDINPSNADPTSEKYLVYRALGPDLYSGTSGVALFLAELQAAVGDEQIRQISMGAIRQALSQAPKLRTAGHLGLYNGATGIALAATYIGVVLGVNEIQHMGGELLRDIIQDIQQNSHSDLISGNAGVILALLILEAISPNNTQRELAIQLGEELVHSAQQRQDLCYWKSSTIPSQRPLTGFSHGTAGMGYALLELFNATGNPRYRDVADMAFNYERACFDERMNNWPDFRGVPDRKLRIERHQNFPVFWCHGAPGIALSLLRAYEILPDNRYKSEALIALNTTKAWIETMLSVEDANFCLCHGLAGNAHILDKGTRALGQDFTGGHELAREVAAAGIEKYARRNHRWPFGLLGDRSPGLMCGLSGVGYFYLSLFNPSLPSFLSPEAKEIGGRLAIESSSKLLTGDRTGFKSHYVTKAL